MPNGKLIGAVSFGFDFSKEPIAGITPIVDMLDALADTSGGKGAIAHLSAPSWAVPNNPQGENGMSTVSSGAPRMVPLMSPVSLTGFSQRAEAFLSKRNTQFSILNVQCSGFPVLFEVMVYFLHILILLQFIH